MDLCIARQPIFNLHKRLHAYELLFRGTGEWQLDNISGNRATSALLSSTFLTEGIERITGAKPCFVNFTAELLLKNIVSAFPKNRLVVEVLEDVEPTPAIVEACRKIKREGYTIALDDFVYASRYDPLVKLASIIKVDFKLTPVGKVHRMLEQMSHIPNLTFLAEKVETYDEFEKALKLGFTYFQGYFFSRPETIEIRELTSVKVNLLRLLAEVAKKKTTISRLEEIVAADVALTYKLLRFLNSAHFYLLEKVTSVSRAIAYLGAKRFRRFVLLVLISEMATDKPEELVRLAIIRAKFCELLAEAGDLEEHASELFIVGLFSSIDAMLDRPMRDILKELPLKEEVQSALIDTSGPYGPILQAVLSYEGDQRGQCLDCLRQAGVDGARLASIYLRAMEYGDQLLLDF